MTLPGSPLNLNDIQKLDKCGIPAELSDRAYLRRVASHEGAELIGRNGNADYSGIVFPYFWPGEDRVRDYRLRRDNPELEYHNGRLRERAKYLSPPGRGSLLYFGPSTDPEWLTDTTLPILLTEGEKKTLALWRLSWHDLGELAEDPRWVSIGLSGVWNWRGTIGKEAGPNGGRRPVKGVIPDIERITWKGRRVVIVYDVDVRTNERVEAARRELSRELTRRGASVEVVDLPRVDGINGIDDLLGNWGPAGVLDLLKTAPQPWQAKPSHPQPKKRVIQRIEDLPRIEDVGSAHIEWDVQRLIPRATVVLLTGEAGAGKSTLACGLAHAVSKGTSFLGRPTIKRPVLILDAENPAVAVIERFQRLRIKSDDNFRLWGQWTGEDPPAAGGAVVLEWVARCQPKPLIVVDSFVRFHPGSENDAGETQRYMAQYRNLAAAGATLLILHHTGKSDTAQDYRGSSDIKASIDIGLKLTNLGDGTRLSLLELRAFKQRISVTAHMQIRYENGSFTADGREAVKTVSEQLVELVKANPGISTAEFEKFAVTRGVTRQRAREFLQTGCTSGTVRMERANGNRRKYFWCESEGEPLLQS